MSKNIDYFGLSQLLGLNKKERLPEEEGLSRGSYKIKYGKMHEKNMLADFLRSNRIPCSQNLGNDVLTFDIKDHYEGILALKKIKELGLSYEPN